MDIERGVIQALFYDYPLEKVAELMTVDNGWGGFLDIVPDLMKWRMASFDRDELKRIWESKVHKWSVEYTGMEDICKPLMYLKDVADEILIKESGGPKVKFQQLLRWRMITQKVGEDLLTLSWLADEEKGTPRIRKDFVWEDVIGIEQSEWLKITENKRLCDLHAHLGGSSDAFNIRWIYWMNKCCGRILSNKKHEEEFMIDSFMNDVARDNPIHLWSGLSYDLNLMEWGGLAAVIRYYLFELVHGKTIDVVMLRYELLQAMANKEDRLYVVRNVYKKIDPSKSMGMTPNGTGLSRWDYALMNDWAIKASHLSSPYMLHGGERSLSYLFFRKLYRKNADALEFAPLFYLYLLIKVRCRREFVQTNNLIGLSNFQDYEENNRSDIMGQLGELKRRYAIQTALGLPYGKNYLECRVKWQKPDEKKRAGLLEVKMERGLFGDWYVTKDKLLRRCRLVVSYNKRYYAWAKKEEWLMNVIHTFEDVYRRAYWNKALCQKDFSIVGIDFTGSDRMARPEVFAPLVIFARAMKPKPFRQFTYHAGEDFFDLMDGLRTIDEILTLLKWDGHCRLGHCLALGMAPAAYYESRGRNVIAPRQVLLDNLVWFVGKMKEYRYPIKRAVVDTMVTKAAELYGEIGYTEEFVFDHYLASLRLRGDHPLTGVRNAGSALLVLSSIAPGRELDALRDDETVYGMFREYFDPSEEQHDKGTEMVNWKMPRDVAGGIKRIQKELMDVIAKKHIALESCPTSNYMIGHFDRYVDLPVMRFLADQDDYKVSINTDDKGIVATSIESEYALMMLAMMKERCYAKDAKKKICDVMKGAEKSKFGMPL